MKKINIVKKNLDFERIIKNSKPYKFKDYIIYLETKTNNVYKFGISVGKKVGKAYLRNRIKRQIKTIIDKNKYENGFNCIIIVGKKIIERSYDEMAENLQTALKHLNIIKENQE